MFLSPEYAGEFLSPAYFLPQRSGVPAEVIDIVEVQVEVASQPRGICVRSGLIKHREQRSTIGVGLARGTDANGMECWYCVQLFLRSGYSISAVDKPATK